MSHWTNLFREDPRLAMEVREECKASCEGPLAAKIAMNELALHYLDLKDAYQPPTGYCPKRTET